MNFSENLNGNEQRIILEGELTVKCVRELWKKFIEVLNRENTDSVITELSGISEIDTAGIQLMMALKIYSEQKKISFSYTGHSLPVLKIIDLYGLTLFFRDKMAITRENREYLRFRYGVKKPKEDTP
jgi:anti-sigma B factor antagonist